jgi:prefoldin subunit 5
MISILASNMPTVMNIFTEGKQRTFFIKEQIPFIEAQVTVNIPTPASILNILTISNTPDQIVELNKKFKKLKNQCKKTEAQISKLISQIDKILSKLERIQQIFTTIDGFISLLAEFIPLLRALITAANIALALQVGFLVSGTAIVRAGDAIKFVKSKIKEIDTLAKITSPIAEFINKEVAEIRDILYPVREKLQELLTGIRARCFYLDSVLIDKLKELELSMTQNPPTGGGVDGPQGTGVTQDTEQIVNALSSQFDPEDILDNLENSNKQRFIEYLVENGFTGYQVVKK